MCHIQHTRIRRMTLAASGIMLLLAGSAMAQTVPVFDDAPSMEQLRSIMIPESKPGLGRTIVIQRPDSFASPVQRAATQVLPAPKMPVSETPVSEAPTVRAAATMPAQAVQPAAKPRPSNNDADAGEAVAFHINFAFNSAVLPAEAHAMIDMMAQLMKESPAIKVRVEGHTDATGAVDYNVALSERRALSVAEYLVKQGIEPARLILIGKGMAEPLTQNRYDPANRRVQFVRVA
jgi:outer membrane protein OmpA-like peptidoglycan-associated protein